MRFSSVLICAWFLGSSAARVRVEDVLEASIEQEVKEDTPKVVPDWRHSEAWFCDCGRLKDLSGEGNMTFNQLTQEVSRKKTNTSTTDFFVSWRTVTRRNEFFAMPEKFWSDAKVLVYKSQGECMSECLQACNSQAHPAARFENKVRSLAAQASSMVHKHHPFARCIPKKDWTCLSNVLVGGASAYRFQEAFGLEVQTMQFHDPADLSNNEYDKEIGKLADARITFLYNHEVFDNSEDCRSQCGSKWGWHGDSWECHFYPSRHFHDMKAAFAREWTSTRVDVQDRHITNKGTGVPQWGCCTQPFYPRKCDLGRVCTLENWLIPEDYFVGDCPPGLETNQTCKDLSASKVQMLVTEACPETYQHANGRHIPIQKPWPVDSFMGC